MKFVANRSLVPKRFEFNNIDETTHAPLAQELFNLNGVTAVFMHQNYISVSKNEAISWTELMDSIKQLIQDFVATGKPVLNDAALNELPSDSALWPQFP